MYQDCLRTLERTCNQPHAVVSAHQDKLSHFLAFKKHSRERIISYSATILALFGVSRSLHYVHDLTNATLLSQALQDLRPNLKEAWAMHTVKNKWSCPTLVEFKVWLKEKTKAHKMMKDTSVKPKSDDKSPAITKTKIASKASVSTSKADVPTVRRNVPSTQAVKSTACNETHPLWC